MTGVAVSRCAGRATGPEARARRPVGPNRVGRINLTGEDIAHRAMGKSNSDKLCRSWRVTKPLGYVRVRVALRQRRCQDNEPTVREWHNTGFKDRRQVGRDHAQLYGTAPRAFGKGCVVISWE